MTHECKIVLAVSLSVETGFPITILVTNFNDTLYMSLIVPAVIVEEVEVSTQVYLVYICFEVSEQYFDGSKLLSVVS